MLQLHERKKGFNGLHYLPLLIDKGICDHRQFWLSCLDPLVFVLPRFFKLFCFQKILPLSVPDGYSRNASICLWNILALSVPDGYSRNASIYLWNILALSVPDGYSRNASIYLWNILALSVPGEGFSRNYYIFVFQICWRCWGYKMKIIPLNLICTFLLIVNCKLSEENNIQTLYHGCIDWW